MDLFRVILNYLETYMKVDYRFKKMSIIPGRVDQPTKHWNAVGHNGLRNYVIMEDKVVSHPPTPAALQHGQYLNQYFDEDIGCLLSLH